MNELAIELKLDRIHCHDEGDGPGNAEPYLWTVFFKVDGETVTAVTDGPGSPHLEGAPTVVGTPGNHGNLGTTDVDEGDDVMVPAIIGEYRTTLKPIPLSQPIASIDAVGGIIGCVMILMEEDGTPNGAIARGHEALDRAMRDALASQVAQVSISQPTPTEADLEALTSQVSQAVKSSIKDALNVFDWLGALGNNDDQIGTHVVFFTHDELANRAGQVIPFSHRWPNEGDWEIFGHVSAKVLPKREIPCCEELKKRVTAIEELLKKLQSRAPVKVPTRGRTLRFDATDGRRRMNTD